MVLVGYDFQDYFFFFKKREDLRSSLPKSGPLDFATKNTFPLFFIGEDALVGIY